MGAALVLCVMGDTGEGKGGGQRKKRASLCVSFSCGRMTAFDAQVLNGDVAWESMHGKERKGGKGGGKKKEGKADRRRNKE